VRIGFACLLAQRLSYALDSFFTFSGKERKELNFFFAAPPMWIPLARAYEEKHTHMENKISFSCPLANRTNICYDEVNRTYERFWRAKR
jgi:hypothetical protein